MIEVVQHIPAYVDTDSHQRSLLATAEEVMALPWIKRWETADWDDGHAYWEYSRPADTLYKCRQYEEMFQDRRVQGLLVNHRKNGKFWVVAYLNFENGKDAFYFQLPQ
jgi:hypothetical protein